MPPAVPGDSLPAPGQGSRGHPQYEFLGVTRFWRYNETKMRQLHHEGRIEFRPQGDVPRLKVYLDDAPGVAIGDVWTDVRGMFNFGNEMLGYPTQKPEALLERIVAASSNEGDVVLDPFCGCGTTISAAQKLNRQWIGIDITHLAITLIRSRLTDTFVGKAEYEVIGEPVSVPDATALAAADPYQFQWWALGLVGARPVEQKKGADRGIDGRIYFHVGDGKSRQVILSVKAGKLHANYVRDLRGVLEREKADMGVLISMEDPTGPCGRKPPARASIRRRGASTRACNLSPSRTCSPARISTDRPSRQAPPSSGRRRRFRRDRSESGSISTSRGQKSKLDHYPASSPLAPADCDPPAPR